MGVVISRQLTKAAWSRVQFVLHVFTSSVRRKVSMHPGQGIQVSIPSSKLSYGVYRWTAPVHRAPKYSINLFSNFHLIIVVHLVYKQLFHCDIFMHVYRAPTPLLIFHAHLLIILFSYPYDTLRTSHPDSIYKLKCAMLLFLCLHHFTEHYGFLLYPFKNVCLWAYRLTP